jgi:hypothetical protein
MERDHVDRRHLRITGKHKAVTAEHHVAVIDDAAATDEAVVVVTQAYGPRGDNLVGIMEIDFDGHPAVTLKVRAAGREGLVHISPIHGDSRKVGFTDIEPGTVLELFCPVSGLPLDLVGEIDDDAGAALGAHYYALYLTPQLSRGSMVMISNVWGHYHSRIVDNFELISAWAAAEEQVAPDQAPGR